MPLNACGKRNVSREEGAEGAVGHPASLRLVPLGQLAKCHCATSLVAGELVVGHSLFLRVNQVFIEASVMS